MPLMTKNQLINEVILPPILSVHFSHGISLREIANYLNHVGTPTKWHGRKWNTRMLARVLTNPASAFLAKSLARG